MFPSLPQGVGRLLAVLTIPLFAGSAAAQWGGFGNYCDSCAQTAAIAAPQYAAAPIAYNACPQPLAMAAACPCMQPVTETVYRDVPVTEYRAVKKTVKKPVLRTVYEERPVTAYRQEMEQRTAEVPTVSYQTVQECRPVTINRSYWQTVYQPVAKMSPCYYDSRPGLLGWANRTSYELRMAFTPNQIRQRQFVPNVQMVNVPYNRTVALPGSRQVSYNVAKLVPYETTEKVARTITEYEDIEVTAYEPHTVTKTVAIGNQTRWAYVDPFGGSTATALQPTPDRRSAEQTVPKKTGSTGTIQRNSFEYQENFQPAAPAPAPAVQGSSAPAAPSEPNPFPSFEQGSLTPHSGPSSAQVAGWRASRRGTLTVARPVAGGPALPTVAAN